MKRYKELVYEDKTYTEPYKINEILVKNKFEWFLDCEVENVRIEILKNTLVFNSGVFFNGTWVYGVFRDGQWKYGTWEGGVWYNGTWENGIFKNGLIFGGEFGGGKIEGGEIRGGNFLNVQIKDEVLINVAKPSKYSPKPQQGHPQNRGTEEKIDGQVQKVQPEKIEEKIVKRYDNFIKEMAMWNKQKLFDEIEKIAKEQKIMEHHYGVESFPENEPYFTTSQETDIWEMIHDGWTKKKW